MPQQTMHSQEPHRALALDFGRVLTMDQDQTVFAPLLKRFGFSPLEFRKAWAHRRLDYDRGDLDTQTYWSQVLGPVRAGWAGEFAEADYLSWRNPRTELHDLVQKALGLGTPTAIVSNMPPGLGDRFTDDWPWLKQIPHRFFSGDFGLTKPDQAFYAHMLRHTGWNPREVLFVDDIAANIEGASNAGFATLLFTGSSDDLARIAGWCGLT